MRVHSAVLALEATVVDAQRAISTNFEGNLAHAQIRAELDGIWHVVKMLASAIDDDGVRVRDAIDMPSRADVEALVKNAADRAAEHATSQRRKRRW